MKLSFKKKNETRELICVSQASATELDIQWKYFKN